MAKTAKTKRKVQGKNSRAARRETSPSLNTDKSLKTIAPPTETKHSFFSAQSAGITKKKPKQKRMSRQQRTRQLRGVDKAEQNMDVMEKKVAKSVGKGRKVKSRNVDWDHLNAEIRGKKVHLPTKPAPDAPGESFDAEMEGVDKSSATQEIAASVPLPEANQPALNEEEEVL